MGFYFGLNPSMNLSFPGPPSGAGIKSRTQPLKCRKFSPGSYWSSSHCRSAYLVIGLVTDSEKHKIAIYMRSSAYYFKVIGGPPVTGTPVGSRTEIAGHSVPPNGETTQNKFPYA